MRFDGRIQFEGVPDELDVTVEVSDSHLRMLSGDEVLGSWCLADVVANRRVADEFDIELPEEAVIFRADDQVNFAYGAVQKMAEGWARYHAMNPMRRRRAVASARRMNEPSRLEAVKQALRDAGDALTAADAGHAQQEEVPTAASPIRRETDQVASPAVEPMGGFWAKVREATEGGVREPPEADEDLDGEADQIERMRSTFGRRGLPRLDPLASRQETTVGVPSEDSSAVEPEPAGDEAPAPWVAPVVGPPPSQPPLPPVEPPRSPREETVSRSDTVLDSPGQSPPAEPSSAGRGAVGRLGAYGDGHHPAETSGIRATMRSMFSRSKTPHEHSFVETTTAAGITRRLCLECGQVSIGVSESEV